MLFEKLANGAADEQQLLVTTEDKGPQDWSSDGNVLLYAIQDLKAGSDLWALPLTGERKPFPVLQTSFDEVQGQFSPDGRWVSTGGGIYPRWRRDGRELFYVTPDNRLMAMPIQWEPSSSNPAFSQRCSAITCTSSMFSNRLLMVISIRSPSPCMDGIVGAF